MKKIMGSFLFATSSLLGALQADIFEDRIETVDAVEELGMDEIIFESYEQIPEEFQSGGLIVDVDQGTLPKQIVSSEWIKELNVALVAAKLAGKEILFIQATVSDLEIRNKQDAYKNTSPVTLADMRANEIICKTLNKEFPAYGILSEESVVEEASLIEATRHWRNAEKTWIIDPLDGTRVFIENGCDYGIHIGLTYHGVPVVGVNYYPVTDTTYLAIKDCGAYKQVGKGPWQQLLIKSQQNGKILPILNSNPAETALIYKELFGKPLTAEFIHETFVAYGSCGWRICSIAEGTRNLYISIGRRGGLWDYCSGEVIFREAGGFISDLNGNPINYRSESGKLNFGSIVTSDKELYERVLLIHRSSLTKPH